MIIIGIESTAHTFGVSIVDSSKKKVLSNVINGVTTESGGMIPSKVADHHSEVCGDVIKKAVKDANIKPSQIDLISFSQGPGLGHSLRIGLTAAKTLHYSLKKPLIGVNHCVAHLEIGRVLTKAKDPVLLYASGANTQVIAYEAGKYRIFGETLDMGVGNFLDSFARDLGLGFPGGPKIYELSLKSKEYVELPYSVKGMDISFGGLQTNLKQKIKSGKYSKESLCFSVQETVFAMLIEVAERAMAHTGKEELLLGGGVACNKRLQEMAKIMCEERGAKCFILENQYNVDNAAMIAFLGGMMYEAGIRTKEDCDINPYERTDDIKVSWR